eukprot:TRINITY_DN15004_c0_g1_i1.p1 TRINITY_DN15004_c0_g1~~TRINITY_DN15004_c0_g1_i1.p1  ORF type:complete len:315 (+),score=51.98 TRINITY_DN15004_c0_g1_i1:60-1004(+)
MPSLLTLAASASSTAEGLLHAKMTDGLVLQVSPAIAILGSLAISLIFVLSLYIWKLVGYEDSNRDARGTIQRRALSALLSCLCSAALVRALATPVAEGRYGLTLPELLGLKCEQQLLACTCCLLLTAALFFGPLAQHLVGVLDGVTDLVSVPQSAWVAARNYALAPLTEEFVFRACLVRLWVAASMPMLAIIFCSPFFFALAHTHHFIEHVRKTRSKQQALIQVAFQVFYTSLFGMYSNFLLLRTGSTLAVVLAHSFCNHQGFPDLAFLMNKQDPLHRHRRWLGAMYLLGIAAFTWLMAPLTAGFSSSFVGAAA